MRRRAFAIAITTGALLLGCQALEPSLGPPREDASDGTEDAAPAGDTDAAAAADEDAGPPAPVSFKNDIRPLMERSDTDPTGHGCKKCHYSTEPSHIGTDLAGFDLSTLGSLRHGGLNTGTSVVVPGDPAKSAIVQKLRGTFATGVRMPFSGPPYWSEAQIALVERWIAEGAKGADSE